MLFNTPIPPKKNDSIESFFKNEAQKYVAINYLTGPE